MRIDLPNPDQFARILSEVTEVTLERTITGITTDSRECQPGDLYIALRGEQTDGHHFLADVENSGASAALVSSAGDKLGLRQIVVDNPLTTIGAIARIWRNWFNIPVVAITGSNGKTTTKELLKNFLSDAFTVHATSGNFNTSIGLPLTLLTLSNKHSLSILEMGANQPGDISYLCLIAQPTHGLITNIAPAHLAGFGSEAAIVKEKGMLFESLAEGTTFVNKTDKWINDLPVAGKAITFGLESECDIPVKISFSSKNTISLTFADETLTTGSYDAAFANNIISACVIARSFAVDWKTIQDKILSFENPPGRCQINRYGDITVVDDTYNANFESTVSAIDLLSSLNGSGRRILVFGDMFELGDHSPEYHKRVAEKCNNARLDIVFTVGTETISTDQELENIPFHQHFNSKEELSATLKDILHQGDKVLIKGSRGMEMETIIKGVFRE